MHTARPTSRRRVWIALFALLVCGLMAGTWAVISRGLTRSDLYEHAIEALDRGDRATAEVDLRRLLDTDPDSPAARDRLVRLLVEDGRFEDAGVVAKEWTEVSASPEQGWAWLIDLELMQGKLLEAERIAQSILDREPEIALITMVRVGDALGTAAHRWEAQRAAVHVATITQEPRRKAGMLLFAAETIRDLEAGASEQVREASRLTRRRYLREAQRMLERGTPEQRATTPWRHLRARVLLLSDDEYERKDGLRTLDTAEGLADEYAVAALAAYHAARGEWDEATERVARLNAGPYLLWLRGVRRLAGAAPVADVLALLDEAPRPDDPLVALLRGQVLLRGTEQRKREAVELLTELARRPGVDSRIVVGAYRLLAEHGQEKAAVAVLESLEAADLDASTVALIVSGPPGSRRPDSAMDRVEGLAGRVESVRESVRVLRILRRGDERALERYLRAPIEAEGVEAARQHLLRASAAAQLAQRLEDGADRTVLRDAATRDLGALQDAASKAVLEEAWRVALAVAEYELGGTLLGRALSLDGTPHDQALVVLAMAANTEAAEPRARLAAGIRGVAESGGPTAFLRALAGAVENPLEGDALLDAFADARSEPASRGAALLLSAALAERVGDRDRARKWAEELIAVWPESEHARALVGEHLLRDLDYDALVEIHAGSTGEDVDATRQVVIALWELGKRSQAMDLAREAVQRHPRGDRSHLLLAHLLLQDRKPEQALGALAVAPGTRAVLLLRARILIENGAPWAAETLYLNLLSRRLDDRDAWLGLAAVLSEQERHAELVEFLRPGIDAEPALPGPLRGELLALRGRAHETLFDIGDALVDYEAAVMLQADNVMALNNAAWLILDVAPERLSSALGYIERALDIQPDNPNLLDTAALVYLRSGEGERALDCIDRALATEKKPTFMVRRAQVLMGLGRNGDAEKQLRAILEQHPATAAASEAEQLLVQLRDR